MGNSIKTLVIVAAIAATASLSLPAKADAQHHYGHGYYGHGYGPYAFGGYEPYGYGGYGPYGYGGYGPYGYGADRYSNNGAVRIEVNPKELRDEIQVYVDEARAGVVDDFDGISQRLYLPPGKYEIEVRLDGYKTHRVSVLVTAGNTYKIRGQLEPLTAAELEETGDAPQAHAVARTPAPADERTTSPATPTEAPAQKGYRSDRPDYGAVRIEANPNELRREARVYVDGAEAGNVDDFDGLFQSLNLPAGKQQLEVRLNGYRTFRQKIFVSPGRTHKIRLRMEPVAP